MEQGAPATGTDEASREPPTYSTSIDGNWREGGELDFIGYPTRTSPGFTACVCSNPLLSIKNKIIK